MSRSPTLMGRFPKSLFPKSLNAPFSLLKNSLENSPFRKTEESQTQSSKRASRELQNSRVQGYPPTLRQPFVNPSPTFRQPFRQPFLPTPSFRGPQAPVLRHGLTASWKRPTISKFETRVPTRGGLKPAGKRQESATFLQRSDVDVAVQFFVCCSAAFGTNDVRTAEKRTLQCSFCSAAFSATSVFACGMLQGWGLPLHTK